MRDEYIRLMIVDDDDCICGLTCDYFTQNRDIEICAIAKDGLTAYHMICELHPDVVLLDIILPGLDGIGVLEKLYTEGPKEKPIIIMMSAIGHEVIIKQAMSLGADYFLIKPFDFETLECRVRQLACYRKSLEKSTDKGEFLAAEAENYLLVTKTLMKVGIPVNTLGYKYIFAAVCMVLADDLYLNAITKELYPKIALKFRTTYACVEKAMRHSIELAAENDYNGYFEDMSYFHRKNSGKLSNARFIGLVAESIKMKKQGAAPLFA